MAAPTENNAHPHATDRVAVVHNGIIENFQELRDELGKAGHNFDDRDRHRDSRASADRPAVQGQDAGAGDGDHHVALHGAFALAILFAGRPDLMAGARRGSPLAIGYGEGEMFLGSDALALAPYTNASAISRKTTGRW